MFCYPLTFCCKIYFFEFLILVRELFKPLNFKKILSNSLSHKPNGLVRDNE